MGLFDRIWRTTRKPTEPVSAPVPAEVAPGHALPVLQTERRGRKRRNARLDTKVLIVDDSATVVAVLRKILRSAGYVTQDAPDAETGLELVAQGHPELIFLDIVLPGMNGFGALRALRRDPATAHIPVIVISGNEHATEQFYANRIGSDGFMKKPFSRFEVFAHIEGLLDTQRVPRRREAAGPPVAVRAPAAGASAHPRGDGAIPVWNLLDARKQLTGMGLQYFSLEQLCAAIGRMDLVAVELFIAGGGVAADVPFEGQTALERARALQHPELVALLQRRPGSPPTRR